MSQVKSGQAIKVAELDVVSSNLSQHARSTLTRFAAWAGGHDAPLSLTSIDMIVMVLWVGFIVGALLSLPHVSLAAPRTNGAAGKTQDESSVTAAATAKLARKQFQNVKIMVENGVAVLTGTVDLYEYKADADKRIHKVKGVAAVRNDIQVGGPTVPDAELKDKLLEKLQYDRVGYGNVFNAITLDVRDGAVTLGGHARTDVDKDSALALVSTYPGVKDVMDDIEVDPVSIIDNKIRLQVARAVYGYPTLNKYIIDPAKTIRISVQNGNVELFGVVDSQADKEVAYLRASQVPGVFSVKSYLQVASEVPEKTASSAVKQN
jgi:hyperosmotically inducible periplasmic protein